MKKQFNYFTLTKNFSEVKISLTNALEICARFGYKKSEAKDILQNGSREINCNAMVKVWSEEKMRCAKIREVM